MMASLRKQYAALANKPVAGFMLAVCFILVVFYLRLPLRIVDGFLWAEDLFVFLREAYDGGLRSLASPYAGYLHTLPRLVAYLLARFSLIPQAPYFYVYACVLIYAACAMYLYRVALRFHPSRLFAAAVAAVPFLTAQSGEIYLSITNLQWIVGPVCLVLIWDTFTPTPEARPWKWRLAALFVLITTGPFAVLFGPAILLILWVNRHTLRSDRSLAALVVCCIAGVVQLVAMHYAPPPARMENTSHDWSHFLWLGQFGRNFVIEFFVPRMWIGNWWKPVALLLAALVVGIAAASRQRVACLCLLVLAVLMWAIGVYRADTPDIEVHWFGYGSRYLFVPYVFCTWALLIALVTTPKMLRWIPALLIAAIMWTSFTSFEGGRWEKWRVQPLGNGSYKVNVAPGMETVIFDRLHSPN
jgi:hypothetical protein